MRKVFFVGFVGLCLLGIVSAGGSQEKQLDEFFFGLMEKMKSVFSDVFHLASALESNITDRNDSLVNVLEDGVNITGGSYLDNISEINFTEEENITLLNFSGNETNLSQVEGLNNSDLNETGIADNDSIQFVNDFVINETEYFYWDRVIVNNYFGDSEEVSVKLKIPKRLENITKGIDYEEKNSQDSFSVMVVSQKLGWLKQELKRELGNKYSEVEVENISILKRIKFNELELDDDFSLGVEELDLNDSVQSYAIDPSRLNFTNASVTLVAKGKELYRCRDWNFSERVCYAEWELFRTDLVPGEEYSFILTPDDPAFREEINITNAVHLDENRSFVSNIFDEVRYQDGLWSEAVYHDEYVRATFEENLTNGNVVNLYVRNGTSDMFVEIYEKDGVILLGSIFVDGENQYDLRLQNMSGYNDVFDIRIVNGENDSNASLEFDYIHDAGSLASFDGNFFEDFESGSLATNGWATSGGASSNWIVSIEDAYNGTYHAEAENTDSNSTLLTNISTEDYGNISFSFWYDTDNFEAGDYLFADWYNGTDWINVLTVDGTNTGAYTLSNNTLTSDANNNPNFAIRFICNSDKNNEWCQVDYIHVIGQKILSINLDDYYGLNSSLGRVDEFNSSNLEEIEYMELNFSIDSTQVIDSWYLNFTANGTNGCSLGNKQSSVCYSYDNATYQWIQFINNTNTTTYDGTQGNQGDRIVVIQTGSGNQVNVSLRIDEHYNPNVFKWYDAEYNFSDVRWQNGAEQRITGDNHIKIEINQTLVPINADQYKLDFRAEYGGNPTQPLEAYACNSSYVDGHVHDFTGCVLVAQKFPSEFQDVGTKFREIFTRNLTDQIGDFKYVVLETNEQNTSNYYAIKTYKATKASYTTHWEYSTNLGDNWTNLNDGYETELNINWFYDGADPTAFVYRFWANDSDGTEEYLEGNITWDIDPTNNYPPLVDLRSPLSVGYLSFPYNITFLLSDPNDDNLNGSLYLYQGGSLNKTLVTDMNQSNESYLWDDSTPDGTYDLVLEACELGTSDLFCVNITQEITVDNSAPSVTNLIPVADTIYYDNITNTIEIAANVTDVSIINVLANITYPDGTYVSVDLTNVLGDKYNNSFQIPFVFGRYNVTIVANDSAGNSNDSETTYFNLEDVSSPSVEIVHPLGHSLDEDGVAVVTLNVSDLSGIDMIYANISSPNGTNYTLTGFSEGLQSDDFDSDSLGVNWENKSILSTGANCIVDIDSTFSGKAFVAISNASGVSSVQCGLNSLKKVDGDFDVNISFNITNFGDDTLFSFRSNSEDSFLPAGIRVYTDIEKEGGVTSYVLGYNNGTHSNSQSVVTSDTFGKFRIKRFNTSEQVPVFNLYYWNNSGSEWVNLLGNISLGGSSRTQFIQIKPASISSNFGDMNITFDDFLFSGDNLTFAEFNQTSQSGKYNVSVFVNDSLGYINDSETSWFNISAVNDAPSRPFITEPDPDEILNGLFNITWDTVIDEEGDSLRFNISLLNSNGSVNSSIVTDYGDTNSIYYEWNTSSVPDGLYGIRVVVFENETAEGNSNSDDIDGNFTIDNSAPSVVVVYPLNHTLNENGDVAISLNVSDVVSIDTIYANVSSPNGTNYTLTDFATGLPNDDFSSDSEGVNWVHKNTSASGQICYTDIDGTVPGKMFFSVDGGTGPTTLQCAYNSLKRVDGDFDLNLTFNITHFEKDSFFTLRSAPTDSLSASGIRVYMVLTMVNGENLYKFGYNDGNNTNVSEISTNDTYGKFRIKRFNYSTGTPVFNLYYWNNSGSEWINVHGNISLPGSSRAQFIQIKPGSETSGWGGLNMTVDDFFISGDNYTFAIFNQTSQVGQYNVSVFANDSVNNINDTETTTFHIVGVNNPPSTPHVEEPEVGDFIGGMFNISWQSVTDDEGDSLRFNVSLLNPDESLNATIVSNYGNSSSIYYEWNSSLHVDGDYRIKVEVYENETAEGNSNSATLGGNFSIDNTYPEIQFVSPTTAEGNYSQDFIVANVTVVDENIDTITISLYNSSGIVNSTTSSASPLFINFTDLPYGTYYLNASVNDSAGNINQTETKTITLEVVDSCTYPGSGNWEVDCSDNCSISSDVDVLGNNISIVGFGSFYTTANITNFSELYLEGDSAVSRCEVYCSGGGCFK
ncbi:hypothetical protein KAT36_02430 [Candidatus Pacearchaeota archaeon]|nr:hypothetical protein [Candidatus Pacearchaeota archaeon]